MATITIKDLPENIDLDHQAMASITGGARVRTSNTIFSRTTFQGSRIVNYPLGFSQTPTMDVKNRNK